MKGQIATGYTVGNGAAINVPLGWYPDMVMVTNITDGTLITLGHLGRFDIPFSGGGTTEIAVGARIKGATTGATAIVEAVLLYSGTWAGGDAAGFLIVRDVVGTFGSENVYVDSDDVAGIDDATVTVNVTLSVKIDTQSNTVSGNNGIARYNGSSSAGVGFTIGSSVATEAKLLFYIAFRGDERLSVAA